MREPVDWQAVAGRFVERKRVEAGLTKPDGTPFDGLDHTELAEIDSPAKLVLGPIVIGWHYRGGAALALGVAFGAAPFAWQRDESGRESVAWAWQFATTEDAAEALAHKVLYAVGLSPARV